MHAVSLLVLLACCALVEVVIKGGWGHATSLSTDDGRGGRTRSSLSASNGWAPTTRARSSGDPLSYPRRFVPPVPAAVYITAAVCACVYHCGCVCMLVRAYITAAVCACSSGDRRPGPTSAAMNGCVDAALGLRMTAAAPCACGCVQRHLQRVCTPPDDAEPVGAEHATGHPPLARAQRRPRNPRAHRYGAPSRGGVCARVCVSLCVCVCVSVCTCCKTCKCIYVFRHNTR